MDLQDYLNRSYTKDELANLTELNLKLNKITDISPLANLTNLTELHLRVNKITDISSLANLTNLTELNLSLNNLTDISPLANLTNLTKLNLNDNEITDISPLANLTNLTELHVYNNNIDNIDNKVFVNPVTNRVVLKMSDGRFSCGCCCNKTKDEFKKICSTKQFNEVIEFFNL